MQDESFIAGMLHDIGKVALASNLPEQYGKIFSVAEVLGLSLHAAEEAGLGAHHGDAGGYLLNLWSLPEPVVTAITYHHEPRMERGAGFTPTAAVYISNALIHEQSTPEAEFLDKSFVSDLGLGDRIEHWKSLCLPPEEP